MLGLSALGGWLGNRKATTEQAQQNNARTQGRSYTNTTNLSSSDPRLSGLSSSLLDQIAGRYTDNLAKDPDLKGYEAGQISNVNQNAAIKQQLIEEQLASRGITGAAVGTAVNNADASRFSDITKIRQQTPILAQQMLNDKIAIGTNLFNSIPYGTESANYGEVDTTTDNRTESFGTGTNTDPGNQLGGLTQSLGDMLAYLYGSGGQENNNVPRRTTDLPIPTGNRRA